MDTPDDGFEHEDDGYTPPDSINFSALPAALRGLELFDDPYLSMQATNLGIVDEFCTSLEAGVLSTYYTDNANRLPEAIFLSAQSQMWIMSAYELVRTWRQRAKEAIKWADNGGLPTKIGDLRKDVGFRHNGRLIRADQLQRLIDQPSKVDKIRLDLRRIHMAFERMHLLRISLAKHEVAGANEIAVAPGYGRINMWNGAIDFELSRGRFILGTLSRRDVADELRAIAVNPPPTEEEMESFDAWISGPLPSDLDIP
ncbi:MAG: hypothetical protein IE912_02665 [Brevundimonas diminuta]|nr:hypothetical protein [Brevundimonas diminuta]MBD3817805.1 hypothetical protein [Brevundimonas diminuta]